MKVKELIDSKEFSFNARFRICRYAPTKEDIDHVDILYESTSHEEIPIGIMDKYISAINQDDNGVVEIECY